MRTSAAVALVWLGLAGTAAADAASEAALLKRVEQLELRIQDLEANRPAAEQPESSGSWTRRVRLGGSADAGWYGGQRNSSFDPDSFLVWDARFFVDADLGRDLRVGDWTVARNAAFSFEWDLVRIGSLMNDVGELFVDLQGLLGRDELNLEVGRFQIPVGETYLRYGQGYAARPFITNPVGGPWWWDEGLRLYGSDRESRFGYVASVSDGETPFNVDSDGDKQLTLKLFWRPWSWLYLSASGLRSGEIGSSGAPANGALWLGETWARAFGSGSGVPSFQGGVAVADGPNRLDDTWLVAGDAVLDFEDRVRVWLAYGRYGIDSSGGSSYDRDLHYWIAEAILSGAWLAEELRPFYLGLRADALGTYDADEGYLLDFRRAPTLGYNMESLTAYSTVLGWKLTSNLRLRAEYTHTDIDLVRGVTESIRDAARNADSFAVEFGASF